MTRQHCTTKSKYGTIKIPQPKGTRTMTTSKPAFSFANLSIEDADVPKQNRQSNLKDNPFTVPMAATYESESGGKITVPTSAVGEAIYLLRAAATERGYGSRIVLQDRHGNPLTMGSKGGRSVVKDNKSRVVGGKSCVLKEDGTEHTGNVVIIFKAKDRKTRKTTTAV